MEVENRTFAKITPKTRIEKQMVDSTALKEAVINAIVHNDYSRNAVPTVEIFSDRITMTSYGGLPEGLSRESFFACCSMPRNRELMRVFRDVGLVEQLGSGMGRILNAYDKSVFEFKGDFLIVTFPFAEGFDAAINLNDDVNDVNDVANGTNDVVNVVNDVANGTNDVANKIIDVFRQNPQAKIKDVAKAIGVTSLTIDREIDVLKASGKLKRVGSPQTGHWEVGK
jgi:predicted HTH transcriptional regulator